MTDRLSAQDVSYLYREDTTAPLHVGSVGLVKPGRRGLTRDDVVALVERRLSLVPRYRQRIQRVPGELARPVWIDDPDFDLGYHVRRAVLPRPGGDAELHEFVARVMARPLDQHRPLWEMYVIEGMSRGRAGVLWKTHEAMVGGTSVDLAQVVLDTTARQRAVRPDGWLPSPAPSDVTLIADAVNDLVRRPSEMAETVWLGLLGVRRALTSAAGTATGLLAAAAASELLAAARPAPPSPLNVPISSHRRFGTVRHDLETYRRIRRSHGATVNDVVLATITGALRTWLMTRGAAVNAQTALRAMVPVGVADDATAAHTVAAGGTRVATYLVDLPIGEPNPVVRLHQISYALNTDRQTGRFVDADTLSRLSGFAPPTLHALGAKAAFGLSRRRYNLVVTNGPGPQVPLYLAGARLLETYPVVPLAKGQALAIGLTSYNGGVYYGLTADAKAMPDLPVLGDMIDESLAELAETIR